MSACLDLGVMRRFPHTLFVCCHSTPGTRGGALMHALQQEWEAQGATFEVSDLAAMHFNPMAGAGDFAFRPESGLSFREAQKRAALDGGFVQDIEREQDKLLRADVLVLVFPLWVFGMPALLKGWIERVFARGFAYGAGMEYATARMAGKRAAAVITAAGSQRDYEIGGKHEPMEQLLRLMIGLPLGYMGYEVLGAKVMCEVEARTLADFSNDCARLASQLFHRFFDETLNETKPLDWRT